MMMIMMMMGLGLIVLLLLIGTVALAISRRPRVNQTRAAQTSQTPVEILNVRYARGEITREEYEQMRRDLKG
jgi:putative membrane protein